MARAGMTPELARRLRRPDRQARIITEAVITTASDVAPYTASFNDADSLTGFTIARNRLELTGSSDTPFDRNTDDQSTGVAGPFFTASTYIATAKMPIGVDAGLKIGTIVAELDPNTGGGQNVSEWVCALYTFRETQDADDVWFDLDRLGSPVRADASGTIGRVTFDFSFENVRPARRQPPSDGTNSSADFTTPSFIIAIWGLQSDGSQATNIGWRTSSGTSGTGATQNNWEVRGWTSAQYTALPDTDNAITVVQDVLPNLQINTFDYTQATVTWSSNPFDLGASPTGTVRFRALGEAPGNSGITYEVRNDADTAWVEYVDGDTPDDLTGVSSKQTYTMRATLTPGTGTTPFLRAIGVEEVSLLNLDNLASVKPNGSLAIDPITLKGEIMEYEITVMRDGIRDFRDLATQVATSDALGTIEFDIWMGHPDLARDKWLFIDKALVDDHEDTQEAIRFICLGANRELAQPVPQQPVNNPDPILYNGATIATVASDIVANYIAIDDRFVGRLPDASTQVSNVLEDTTAKDVLDQLAYIQGGGIIASQGVIQYRQLYDAEEELVTVFRREEVTPTGILQGAQYRTPRAYINYAFRFDKDDGGFDKTAVNESTPAVSSYGLTAFQKANVPDEVGKWVIDGTTASNLVTRLVEAFSEGMLLWRFRTAYAYPEIEPGDRIGLEVEEFVTRDSNGDRVLKGKTSVVGVVTACHTVEGTEFDVWIQDLSDIIGTTTDANRQNLGRRPGSIQNFRVADRLSTSVRLEWEIGGLVDHVDVYNKLLSLPLSSDPWPSSTATPDNVISSTATQAVVVGYPDGAQARYVQLYAYTASGTRSEAFRQIIEAPRPPVIETAFDEDVTSATLFASVQGFGISAVEFRTKTGRDPVSTYAPATRSSGDASVIFAGNLGPGQYETDVTLASKRVSFIEGRVTLTNGDTLGIGPVTFDANTNPNILSVSKDEPRVTVTGDSDVQSILLKRTDGGSSWRAFRDGFGRQFDISVASTNGAAGQPSTGPTWFMRAVAFNRPKNEASTGVTASDTFDFTMPGPGSTAGMSTVVPMFAAPYPTLTAPSTEGDNTYDIRLKATVSSTSYDYKLESRYNDDGAGYTTWVDITNGVSPQPGTASTTLETFTEATNFDRDPGALFPEVTYQVRSSILTSTGGLVDQDTDTVTWAYLSTFSTSPLPPP